MGSATPPILEAATPDPDPDPAVIPAIPVRIKVVYPEQQSAGASGKSYMFVRRRSNHPAPQPVPLASHISDEIKQASAPKKRVISDGHWVRHRPKSSGKPANEPEQPVRKKSPPRVPKALLPQLAWVRPPLLSRHTKEDIGPIPQLELGLALPPIRIVAGKLRKPLLHQFIPGSNGNKLNSGVFTSVPRRLSVCSDTSSSSATSVSKKPLVRESKSLGQLVSESTILDDSSLDLSIVETKPNARQRNFPSSTSRTSPAARQSERTQGKRSSAAPVETRLSCSPSRPKPSQRSRDARRTKSEEPELYRLRCSKDDIRDRSLSRSRKPSYNEGDAVPVFNSPSDQPLFAAHSSRVSAWLTTTSDPFVDDATSSKLISTNDSSIHGSKSSKTTLTSPSSVRDLKPSRLTSASDLSLEKPQSSKRKLFVRHSPSESRNQHADADPNANADADADETASTPRTGLARSGRRERKRPSSRLRSAAISRVHTESTLSTSSTPSSLTSQQNTSSEASLDLSSNTSSVSTLKRRSANRASRPVAKDKIRSKSISSLDVSSMTSESDISRIPGTASYLESSVLSTSDRDPDLTLKRPFPTTGKRLSTIASVETFATKPHARRTNVRQDMVLPTDTTLEADSEADRRARMKSARLSTSKPNPISQLPTCNAAPVRPGTPLAIAELMSQLTTDESVYMPELRTLVGGVIKVLFRAVLSKSDAALAAGLFSKFTTQGSEQEARYAIHEMGVALERLKSVHIRMSKSDPLAFLAWAKNAHAIYAEYVRTWRLGFQDVVVNLVPAEDGSVVSCKDLDGTSMADALPQNEAGFVTNARGELVDVAFLLKRPFVRLKNLTKTISGINAAVPSSLAADLSAKYQALVQVACKKVNDERARMEDLAAASIDTSQCKDLASMDALSGVKILPNRFVMARDVFEMHLIHSTGQEIISRVEVLLRKDAPGNDGDGDVLISQSAGNNRWLLIPPISLKHISSRKGEAPNQLVVMAEGIQSHGEPWRELFTLTVTEPEIADEWLTLLGTKPVPPTFNRETLVKKKSAPLSASLSSYISSLLSESDFTSSVLSQSTGSLFSTGIEIPSSVESNPKAQRYPLEARRHDLRVPRLLIADMKHSIDTRGEPVVSLDEAPASSREIDPDSRDSEKCNNTGVQANNKLNLPRDFNETMQMAGSTTPLRRSKAQKRKSATISLSSHEVKLNLETTESYYEHNHSPPAPKSPSDQTPLVESPKSLGFSVWIPNSEHDDASDDDEDTPLHFVTVHDHPTHKRSSSMPIQRKSSEYGRAGDNQSTLSLPSVKDTFSIKPQTLAPVLPFHHPNKGEEHDLPPPPPPHKMPTKKLDTVASAKPQLIPDSKLKRRSSSPLKQVWNHSDAGSPSNEKSCSDMYDELDTSDSEDEDDQDDLISNAMLSEYKMPGSVVKSGIMDDTDSITPSQSASQGPSKNVPQLKQIFMGMLAEVSQWDSVLGEYVSIHDKECLCEIGSGKISAYEMIVDVNAPAGFRNKKRPNTDPIVALILTPSVTIQLLNAIDILICSDLSWDSNYRRHDKSRRARIRFHSRIQINQQAVLSALYRGMHSNPVMAHLEANRPRETQAEIFDRQNPGGQPQKAKSWWSGSRRTSSFRKTHTRSGSTVGNTEYSNRTTSSIRRGLNQLLAKTTSFNIDRSTIQKRSRASSDRDGEIDSYTPADAFSRAHPEELQRVIRSTRCKVVAWEKRQRSRIAVSMGRVTIHVLYAPRDLSGEVAGIKGPQGIHSGKGMRIVLANDTKILLDHVLPPGCFSLDPRGIIVHIFDEKENGMVAQRGGVGTLTSSTFALTHVRIQFLLLMISDEKDF